MSLPTPFTVGIRTHSEGATDAHGNPVESWSAPVDAPVYGWAPAGTAEPFEAGRDAITWDLDLYVPPDFTVSPEDRVVVDGVEFTVEGRLEDFTKGPFGFTPGGRIRLKRVDG